MCDCVTIDADRNDADVRPERRAVEDAAASTLGVENIAGQAWLYFLIEVAGFYFLYNTYIDVVLCEKVAECVFFSGNPVDVYLHNADTWVH